MLPEAFVKRIKEELGPEEAEAFFKSFEARPYKALRINRLKKRDVSQEMPDLKKMFSLKETEWYENGCYYEEDTQPGKHPFHEAGAYYIQEASAMVPPLFLDVKPGMRILDLCAAPGGKATEIAELLDNTGLLVANEPDKKRAATLSLNIERLGIGNCIVTNEMPERLSTYFQGFFDRILVDAPCSGEGMFRKNSIAIDEWSEDNVRSCGERQDKILKEASGMLCPGGIMVYSTCTFSKEENEGSIERFLKDNKDFSLPDPEFFCPLPAGFSKSYINGVSGEGYAVRIWPHRVKGEGHFFAVLKRDGENSGNNIRVSGTGSLKAADPEALKLFTSFSKEVIPGLRLPEGTIHSFGDQLYFSNSLMPGIRGLKTLRPGLHLGTVRKGRFIPSHALALYIAPHMASVDYVLSSEEEALKYLNGESIPLSDSDKKGFCIVSFSGFSLGWGKSDGRIVKNHYPKGLRIRI